MKTLLVILSHSGANETVQRHWPWYERAGCDILGVGRENTNSVWPLFNNAQLSNGNHYIGSLNVGQESGPVGANHIERFTNVLQALTVEARFMLYERFAIIEYDGIFTKPIPDTAPGLTTKLAGHLTPGFMSEHFYHTPWIVDEDTGIDIVRYGKRMLKAGLIEHGFIDRWLGLMHDLYKFPLHDLGHLSYTQNTILPHHYDDARKAVKNGAFYLHGVKTHEALEAINGGLMQ